MRRRFPAGIAMVALAVACGVDHTITHGADGKPEWDRRLAAAIPIGLQLDSARAIMLRNGFRCEAGADSLRYLWCAKQGGGRFDIVRRRWSAVLTLDAGDRVSRLRATTDLIGP